MIERSQNTVTDASWECRECYDHSDFYNTASAAQRAARRHTLTTGHRTGVSITRIAEYRRKS